MKKVILFPLTLVSYFSYGQQQEAPDQKLPEKNQYMCQHLELTEDKNKIILRENVRIDLDNLYVEADSAVLDNSNHLLVVYGVKRAKFSGEAVLSDNPKNTIRYTFGEKKIYIE